MSEQPTQLRIALLTSDDAHHRYLAAELHRRFGLAALVVEPSDCQHRRLWRRRRWIDWAALGYHRWRRTLVGLNAYRRAYFALPPDAPEWPTPPSLTVDWINRDEVVALLEETAPDVTVVICTSILSRRTLAATGTTINIHGGFLPWYRGNQCFFFALYDRAFDRIGSTIHFVDAGVDTGDLITRITPPLYADDTAEKLYCRAEKAAIHRLVELLADLEAGVPLPRAPQSPVGRQYRNRDRNVFHDLRLFFRRKRGALGIPTAAAAAGASARVAPSEFLRSEGESR
ncbi:formyl transferase [Burkholderia sp. FERM BP-3421]|uniref:formyl transferase n=1 Tax=Burkholderia sp. FERM BP-3421 TaxID=1494466 RepID=UPI00235EE9E1|nr:formyl transferase [Burkholderia sp. FERM BP-3421]WDD93599.1 formyl transferase [Burkholderia sp. FERM BP-3421]